MTDAFPRGKTAIVGAATFGMGEAPGYTTFDLAAHASVRALAQAGLAPKDVDALFVVVPDDSLSGLSFSDYLGIHPRLVDNTNQGGSSFQTHALVAALALAAGQCDVALIAYASNQRSTYF
jgi:acetyl-CoA acetyltransferase